MALDKATLQAGIKAAFDKQKNETSDRDACLAKIAEDIANAIDTYVKSGTVATTVTGTIVSGGAVTGTGTGTIS